MNFRFAVCLAVIFTFLSVGCATTQNVTLGKLTIAKPINSVAQVREEGNPSDMNAKLETALQRRGLAVKPPLPVGTRTANDVDALVSYTDEWRWDIIMYLKSITLKVYDAESGDLLAICQWDDSTLHGFRDSSEVVQSLVNETFQEINSGIKP